MGTYTPNLSFGTYTPNLSMSYPGTSTGGGMDPLIGASLIQGGGGLLASLLAGDQYKKQAEAQYKYLWKPQYETRLATAEKFLKPKYARYNIEKDLPAWDKMLKQFTLSRLGTLVGGEGGGWAPGKNKYAKYADLARFLSMPKRHPSAPATPQKPVDRIMAKYGMEMA